MKTEAHLRRIRIRLTVVYALMMGVALFALALLAVNTDERVRNSDMNEAMLGAAQFGASGLVFDEDEIVLTNFVDESEFVEHYPQLFLFVPDDEVEEPFVSEVAGPVDSYWPDADIRWYASGVINDGTNWTGFVWDGSEEGGDVVVRGVPLVGTDAADQRAAVVAVANPADWLAGNDDFRQRVFLITAALVAVAAGAGYAIAGRTIRPTARALEQQERLITDAAHELRTPMARIRAAAEGGLAGDESGDAALQRVAGMAADAGEGIDDLLTLSRMDAGRQSVEMESLRLDLLAEQVIDKYPDIEIETVATVVDGDPGLLRRAIDNLVRNAMTHARRDDETTPIRVTVYPNRVVVSDGGPGIDPEMHETLFDRFHSRPGSTGHGLGLPIVQWVSTAHRGRVEVGDADLGGAEFRLVLPS